LRWKTDYLTRVSCLKLIVSEGNFFRHNPSLLKA
jgi:hypothetical protein